MWVIFRDPNIVFDHLDKFVYEVVNDEDILAYQAHLCAKVGGAKQALHTEVYFLQPFVNSDDTHYFARRYNTWTQRASK